MTSLAEPSVAGTTVLDGRAALGTLVGVGVIEAALRTLDPRDAEVYEGATSMSWVPVRIVDQVLMAVARADGRDAVALNSLASRVSVERTVRTVWRPFLRITTDAAIITRAPLLYRKSFSHGTLDARMTGENTCELDLTDWPGVSDLQVAGVAAGIAAVLSVAGRKSVNAVSHRTPGGAHYRVTWR